MEKKGADKESDWFVRDENWKAKAVNSVSRFTFDVALNQCSNDKYIWQ